jgi:hypothetical protein
LEVEKHLQLEDMSRAEAQTLLRSLPAVEDLMPELNVEKIEAIARAADQKQPWRRLWRDDEPMLTVKPIQKELPPATEPSAQEAALANYQRAMERSVPDFPVDGDDDGVE